MLLPIHSAPPPPYGAAGERIGPAGATEPGRRRRARRAGSTCALGVRGGGWSGGTTGYIFTDGEGYLYIYIHVRRLYIKYIMLYDILYYITLHYIILYYIILCYIVYHT